MAVAAGKYALERLSHIDPQITSSERTPRRNAGRQSCAGLLALPGCLCPAGHLFRNYRDAPMPEQLVLRGITTRDGRTIEIFSDAAGNVYEAFPATMPADFPCIMCGREPGTGRWELCPDCRQRLTAQATHSTSPDARDRRTGKPSTRATIDQGDHRPTALTWCGRSPVRVQWDLPGIVPVSQSSLHYLKGTL